MKSNLVSVCIPAWEYFGHGVDLIRKIFDTLSNQTNKNFEVIISDQSKNNNIEKFINESQYNFKVKHFYYTPDVTYVANVNNAIKNASGNIIKPLFQADFFLTNAAINDIIEAHSTAGKCWCALRYNHCDWDATCFSEEGIPYYNENLIIGNNTISSPSTISYDASFTELFDEKLKMLMDCDFYYRLNEYFGDPIIIKNEVYVTNRKSRMEIKYDPNVTKDIPYDINRVIEVHNLKQRTDINLAMSPFRSFIK